MSNTANKTFGEHLTTLKNEIYKRVEILLDKMENEPYFIKCNKCQHIQKLDYFLTENKMNDKDKENQELESIYNEVLELHGSIVDTLEQKNDLVNDVWQWIEAKKEQWELLAFHDGYQTRCDEDEMINRPVKTKKAIKAIKHKAGKYQRIIKLKLNSKLKNGK